MSTMERAVRLQSMCERLGAALDEEVKQARALGELGLERKP